MACYIIKGERMDFSIIIPTCNHWEKTIGACLESLDRTTDFAHGELIIVSNGSAPETVSKLRAYAETRPYVRVIIEGEKLGYPKATNIGIKAAQGEYIILLNDDCVLLDQSRNYWVETLKAPFLKDKKMGITGSLRLHNGEVKHDFLLFFNAMIHRKVIDRLGLLDERFGLGAGEDTDYCIRAKYAGFKIVQVPDDKPCEVVNGMNISQFPIYHRAEGTMHDPEMMPREVWDKNFERNGDRLVEKHFPIVHVLVPKDNWDEYWQLLHDSDYQGDIIALYDDRLTPPSYINEKKNIACIPTSLIKGHAFSYFKTVYCNQYHWVMNAFNIEDAHTITDMVEKALIKDGVVALMQNGTECFVRMDAICQNLNEDASDFRLPEDAITEEYELTPVKRDKSIHIIIPTYQRMSKLGVALESVWKQSIPKELGYTKICVHVVYDGIYTLVKESIEELFEKAPEGFECKFYEIEHEGRWGGAGRKHVLDTLLGWEEDYVMFLDDDNKLEPDYIEQQMQNIYSHEPPADISICKIQHLGFNKTLPTTNNIVFTDIDSLNFMVRLPLAQKHADEWLNPADIVDHDYRFIKACESGTLRIVYIEDTLGYHGQTSQLLPTELKYEFQAITTSGLKRLNLGCGDDIKEGYINIDLYNDKAELQCDIAKLPFGDNKVDEVLVSHVLEHYHFHDGEAALKEWYRVLKPGGKIKIEVPDFYHLCKEFTKWVEEGQPYHELYGYFFSDPWNPGHQHLFMYTEGTLKWRMEGVGFKNIVRLDPVSGYYHTRPHLKHLFLYVEAEK